MIFKIKSFLRFLWQSKNEHAVHSPFVFNLITQCFYDVKIKPEYSILKQFRNSIIEAINSSSEKNLPKRHNSKLISKHKTELLYRIVHYFNALKILEIGNSYGLATATLTFNNKNANIMSFSTENLMIINKLNTKSDSKENTDFLKIQFLDEINDSILDNKFDLIFFNSDNYQKDILKYFTLLIPTHTNDSVWIIDEIHLSQKMEEIWKLIQNHQKVTVTIDTFGFGFVFFRKEQSKQHFIIRI